MQCMGNTRRCLLSCTTYRVGTIDYISIVSTDWIIEKTDGTVFCVEICIYLFLIRIVPEFECVWTRIFLEMMWDARYCNMLPKQRLEEVCTTRIRSDNQPITLMNRTMCNFVLCMSLLIRVLFYTDSNFNYLGWMWAGKLDESDDPALSPDVLC